MTFLQTLRNTPWLAKLALLWFALTLGVAVASLMVNPQQGLIICTSAGMVKVILNADGFISTAPSGKLSCARCARWVAPPRRRSTSSCPSQRSPWVMCCKAFRQRTSLHVPPHRRHHAAHPLWY